MTPAPVKKSSYITRIFDELVRNSRRTGKQRNARLKGGAEFAVLVVEGVITLTIKRPEKRVGDVELRTFREHCGVPLDAAMLTPPEQATRDVRTASLNGFSDMLVTWYYVTYRWRLP